MVALTVAFLFVSFTHLAPISDGHVANGHFRFVLRLLPLSFCLQSGIDAMSSKDPPVLLSKCSKCNRPRLLTGTELEYCGWCATAIFNQGSERLPCAGKVNKTCQLDAIGLADLLGSAITHCQYHITVEDKQRLTANAGLIASYCPLPRLLANEPPPPARKTGGRPALTVEQRVEQLPTEVKSKVVISGGKVVCAQCLKTLGTAAEEIHSHNCEGADARLGGRPKTLEAQLLDCLPEGLRSKAKSSGGKIVCSSCSHRYPNEGNPQELIPKHYEAHRGQLSIRGFLKPNGEEELVEQPRSENATVAEVDREIHREERPEQENEGSRASQEGNALAAFRKICTEWVRPDSNDVKLPTLEDNRTTYKEVMKILHPKGEKSWRRVVFAGSFS